MKNAKASFFPQRVLAVMAHPDDIEVCCGGSIARWIRDGAEVYYLILTNGCNGSANPDLTALEISAIRQDEQRAAARVLGIKRVMFCDYTDCNLASNNQVKRDIVRAIRKVKPDTVITIDPTMLYSLHRGVVNHADHRAAGEATIDAVFPLARDHLAFPELVDKEKLAPHKVKTLLLINYDKSNFCIDISTTLDKKLRALAAHKSQFPNLTVIQNIVTKYAREAGEQNKCQYAESFIRLDIPQE